MNSPPFSSNHGSPFTVNQQRLGSGQPPFGAVVGAGVRMVSDLGDPAHVHLALSTGQSGDPESPHFMDQLERWRSGELFAVALDLDQVDVEADVRLVPADAR